ncbi:MAG: putative signal transduction protein [Ignavibacteria bacterium]|nr:MAG: putative signal transduction protein [Ignavibacteria bacterium]KAF0160341.1 MAG: putative signal transduction protein [Ignavibacteria bacterium]
MEQHSAKAKDTLKRIGGLNNLISIPKIIFEVSQTIKSEPGNIKKLARLIEKDQGLTTKILSVANSPLFGLQKKVSSLEFALMIMGTDEVVRIVTAISLSESLKVKSTKDFEYIEYWKHSMLVGMAARDMSIRLGFSDLSGEAFLAGMLHDVSIQVFAQHFQKEFEEIINASKSSKKFFDCEKEILGISHDYIGKILAERWRLPEIIAETIEYHHLPSSAAGNKQIASLIHLADSMTQEFKIGHCFWDKTLTFDGNVVELLNFKSAEEMVLFVSEYEEVFRDTAESIVF